jgi:4-hydroxybenzoate polyprenyltransferase
MSPGIIFRFARPATVFAPITGIVGGAIAAAGELPSNVAAAVVSAVLLTGASNGINQIADVATDQINRPNRPLPSGALTLRGAWWLTILFGVGALASAALVGREFLWCVAATIPLTSAYSLPPFRTKRIPFLANLTIAIPRGLLLVVAGWAAGGGAGRSEAWTLGALSMLYVFGAATTKDFGDVEGDHATGCVTLPILWGARPAARFVAPFLVVPFLLYPVAAFAGLLPGGVGRWAVLGGLLALPGLAAATLLVRDPEAPKSGRPHPAWGLMYLQLTAAPIGAAVLLAYV